MTATWRYARPPVLDRIPIDRHAVIEASAGTGKTYTLEHLVVELLLRGATPIDRILVVTFTEKATREMRQRVRDTIDAILRPRPGDPCVDPAEGPAWTIDAQARTRLRQALTGFDRAPISTIHGFCQRVLMEHPFVSGAAFVQELVDGRRLFGRCLREEVREALGEGTALSRVLREEAASGGLEREEGVLYSWLCEPGAPMPAEPDPAEPFTLLVHGLVPRVRARMDALKRSTGQLDFDDLLSRLQAALAGPRGPALIAQLRRTYRHCLVDEFQDTDGTQWDIFRRIFFESPEGHRLFAIGDPKQAIYGFRGADVHAYLRARDAVRERGECVPLLQSFRSTAPMIEAHNLVFGEGFFEGEIRYEPIECGRPSLGAVDEAGEPAPPVVLVNPSDEGKLAADPIREALGAFIAREARRLVEGGALRFGPEGEREPLCYSDLHVLVRSGKEAEQVGDSLRRHGVPHAFFKQEGLFQTAEAGHIRDVLAAVADPDDRSLRLRAWLTPFFAVRLEDLTALRDLDETHPLVAKLHRFHAMAEAQDLASLFRALVEETGLARRQVFLESSERGLTNYLHIFELLLEQGHRRRRSLEELVAELDAFMDRRAAPPGENGNVQRLESEKQAVQILTMHKAKGLEAAVVFLAGGFTRFGGSSRSPRVCHREGRREAWLGKGPSEVEAHIAREARQEDERLLYVALTRAKARVYVPYFGAPPAGAARPGRTYAYKHLAGCHRHLNSRLAALAEEGTVASRSDLFACVDLSVDGAAAARRGPERADDAAPVRWDPPASLLAPLPDRRPEMAALRASHRGQIVTSYTRIKGAHGGYRAPEAEGEEFTAEAFDAALAAADADGLPGGSSVGVFLHEVLEELAFEGVARADDADAWGEDPAVAQLFQSAARRNGVAPRHIPEARRLVHRALRAPVRAGELELPAGLCAVGERLAEMRFHYPIPELSHPTLGAPRPAADAWPFHAERGYVRGVVDLVFEHGGRVYFLDWKSDRLPSWSADAVASHVARNYALQARLYGLGVLRLLDVRTADEYESRFGGLLYCFLRGMDGSGSGVYFERPSFDEVLAWEADLRAEESFGPPEVRP